VKRKQKAFFLLGIPKDNQTNMIPFRKGEKRREGGPGKKKDLSIPY